MLAQGLTWVLDINDQQVTGARYLAPLPMADLGGCHEPKPLTSRSVAALEGFVKIMFLLYSPSVPDRSRAEPRPRPARHAAD